MRRNIPSRVCDRCGEVYELYSKGPRKAHALRVHLEDPEEKPTIIQEPQTGFLDLCKKCRTRTRELLDVLVFSTRFDEMTVDEIVIKLSQ